MGYVKAVVWGGYDNDGFLDLCGHGRLVLGRRL